MLVDGAIAVMVAATATPASSPPVTLPHRLILKGVIKALLLVLIRRQESSHWRSLLCCGSGCAKELRAS